VDQDLILRARLGDLRALEELIGEYQLPVGRFVVSRIGPGEDYLDLCQIIFVKMMHGLPRLKSASLFEPWLYQIARNVCTDYLRRRGRHRGLFTALEPEHELLPAEPSAQGSPAADSLEAAVRSLGTKQRELLDLAMERPRTYEELARLTHLSVAAVRNRLFRSRERLRKLLRRGKDVDDT
jgi:RNA polymerase sigma-70 factor (ECF subfamily)